MCWFRGINKHNISLFVFCFTWLDESVMNSLPMVFISSSPGEFHSTYDYCFRVLIILGLLDFILKEWCTISRGAKPHARKANDEEVLKRLLTLVAGNGTSEAMALNTPLL